MTNYPVKYAPASPDLRWLASRGHFVVVKGFTAMWVLPGGSVFVRVPKGFTTDLASIPRAFTWLIPKLGRHVVPAIVHDYCYEKQSVWMDRKKSDALLLDGMIETGTPRWKRNLMAWAVRQFGGPIWNAHHRKKS